MSLTKIDTPKIEYAINRAFTGEVKNPLFTNTDHEEYSFEPVYLDPEIVHLEYEGENLTFSMGEGFYLPRVTLRRCFPLSHDETLVLVKVPESEENRGYEVGILRDLDKLDETSQAAIARELRFYYFVPVIQRIENIKEEFGFQYWTVQTDRGIKEFVLRDNIVSSTRQVAPRRWLLIDINQARYEIHDLERLEKHSQDMIKRYLLL